MINFTCECGEILNEHTPVTGKAQTPGPHDIIICFRCQRIYEIGSNFLPRRVMIKEIDDQQKAVEILCLQFMTWVLTKTRTLSKKE